MPSPEKPPYLPLFVDDYLSDEKLQLCSLAAQGLWMRMLCLMHKCDRRGYLQQANGQPYSQVQISRFAGCTPEEAAHLLRELFDSGVPSVSEHGVWYNRRMVRDEHIRQVRSKSGRKGGKRTGGLLKQKLKQNRSKPPSKSQANTGMDMESNTTSSQPPGNEGGGGGRKPRSRNELFDAIAEVTGLDPSIRSNGSLIAGVCSQLRESDADPAYGPEDVRKLAEVWPTCAGWTADSPLTPGCVAKYIAWSRNPPKHPHLNGKASPGRKAATLEDLAKLEEEMHRGRST